METMAFYHTLKTFTFCGTNHFDFIAFGKNVNRNGFTNIFFNGKVPEFFREFLRSCRCSVSYTHLDVYKRQVWIILDGSYLSYSGFISFEINDPVFLLVTTTDIAHGQVTR